MGTGHGLRMGRVFKPDKRTVIVAMDHLAVFDKPIPALADSASLVGAIRRGGGDAVLITGGALRQAAGHLDGLGVVLSVSLSADAAHHVPEVALRAGVDMIKVVLYSFMPGLEHTFAELAALTAACERWDLPVLVETVPGGFSADASMREAETLAAAARIAVELGASAVKTFLPERLAETSPGEDEGTRVVAVDLEGIREMCRYVPVPVVMLGGDPIDLSALSANAAIAVGAGAAGVAVGRNVWGHPNPAEAVAALSAAVHQESRSGER